VNKLSPRISSLFLPGDALGAVEGIEMYAPTIGYGEMPKSMAVRKGHREAALDPDSARNSWVPELHASDLGPLTPSSAKLSTL
jgi:hypothetical protein